MADTDTDDSSLGGAVGTGNSSRVAMLEQINDQNEASDAAAGAGATLDENGNVVDFGVRQPDGSVTKLTDAAASAVEQGAAEVAPEQTAQPQKHRVKVNGREMELTTDELILRAQKIESADQYLAEAARLRNELIAKNQQPEEQSQDASAAQVEEDLALARAIQMGDEAAAVAAIRKLRESNKGPSTDDLTRTIDDRLTFNEAIANFRTTYSDLVADPRLHKMVQEMDADLIAKGDRRSYEERYTEIGDSVRAWVGQFKPAAKTPTEDKQARKEGAPTVPLTAGSRAPNTREDEKEETVQDVIAGMAASRGGAQWMRGMDAAANKQ